MVNPMEEKLIGLLDVPAMLPPRNGRPLTVRAIYRWARNGIRGVKLETLNAPGGRCTSREAVTRFLERLSMPSPSGTARTPSQRTTARRRAAEMLDHAGIK